MPLFLFVGLALHGTPFWALPLLAIARVEARQIMGYTLLALGVAAVIFVLGLTLLGF